MAQKLQLYHTFGGGGGVRGGALNPLAPRGFRGPPLNPPQPEGPQKHKKNTCFKMAQIVATILCFCQFCRESTVAILKNKNYQSQEDLLRRVFVSYAAKG